MIVDFSAQVYDLHNVAANDENGKPLTIGALVTRALLSQPREKLTPDEMLKRFSLAQQIVSESALEIKIDDASRIKKAAGESLTILAYGRVCEALGEVN